MTSYWWVNQGQSYFQEIGGGYLWAPKKQRDGSSLRSYDLMVELEPGDIVFSHFKGQIQARGIVVSRAASAGQPPDLLKVGENLWNNDGWQIDVEFEVTPKTFSTKENQAVISSHLLSEYPKPISSNGSASQKNYLTRISPKLAMIINESLESGTLNEVKVLESIDALAIDLFDVLGVDLDGLSTEKRQEILARRGQGLFRNRVRNFEKCCRVTRVSDARLLIASHIKPWKDCSDLERLNGANGLLLSPHVDKLFDSGLMTFSGQGKIYFSRKLSTGDIHKWNLQNLSEVGKFTSLQSHFLEFHNDVRFQA